MLVIRPQFGVKTIFNMSKPKHIKPGLYAIYFENLKDIACEYGFNLVVHGSLNRDLDLIAIPWA